MLSGARLRIEADSLLPVGIEPDRGGAALAGGVRRGWEAWVRLPVPVLDGLHVEGSLQEWDEPWSYMPRRIYRGAAVYHRTFLETGNFEMWATVGVVGHDPMTVRQVVGELTDAEGNVVGPELGAVPFYQSWYGRLQLRIVTVRVFLGWDNFTIRRNLQDFPGPPAAPDRARSTGSVGPCGAEQHRGHPPTRLCLRPGGPSHYVTRLCRRRRKDHAQRSRHDPQHDRVRRGRAGHRPPATSDSR